MKTSRLLTAILLVASSAMAKAAVSHTVPGADGTSTPFIVGNVFDFQYETQGRGGVGHGNVFRNTDPSPGANAASETPDHASSYTGRSGSSAAEKAPVANGAAAGPRGGFSGGGAGAGAGAGGAGASGKSSGPESSPESPASVDSTPAEGLKPLKNDTFLANVPSAIALPTDAAQEVSPAAGGSLENPVDWNWANPHDRDKDAWKFTNRNGASTSRPVAGEVAKALTTENPETRRGPSPKNQDNLIRKSPVVSAPEPAGAMTMAAFLGLAVSARRRSVLRL